MKYVHTLDLVYLLSTILMRQKYAYRSRLRLVEVVQMIGGLNNVIPSHSRDLMRYPDDPEVQDELREMFDTYVNALFFPHR